jgi:hypothetical protein
VIALRRELQRRREALVIRSSFQRLRISVQVGPAARRLAAVDRVVAVQRAHPVAMGVALTGLALIGPRALFRWAVRIAPIYSLLVRS